LKRYEKNEEKTTDTSGYCKTIADSVPNTKKHIGYLGVWKKVNNPDLNYPEFGLIEQGAGTNRFIMSFGQWIDRTNAVDMLVKLGHYDGNLQRTANTGYSLFKTPSYLIISPSLLIPSSSIL